ncbi:GAF domain-containing protein [Kaistia adipata]|uniref:GAF domain-containing protein n=1 Tax=Kaistia adipata TaxID=166954 RepID=UPI00040AC28B|nr:GAF domain-containing protein [Kaistia adipata]
MTDTAIAEALVAFDAAIATTTEVEGVWKALQALADVIVGAKLFTVMRLDWANDCSARTFTSHPDAYPVSGTKPINRTHWFETIHVKRQPFVANTIKDIADVFPDHETIWSLGTGSVLNWPVFVGDRMLGTVNMLHEEHYYTPERVEAAKLLSLAAKAAFLAVEHLERG